MNYPETEPSEYQKRKMFPISTQSVGELNPISIKKTEFQYFNLLKSIFFATKKPSLVPSKKLGSTKLKNN